MVGTRRLLEKHIHTSAGDAAFGPKNIITAVAHGHEAAVSIDRLLQGQSVKQRPPPQAQPAPQDPLAPAANPPNDGSNPS